MSYSESSYHEKKKLFHSLLGALREKGLNLPEGKYTNLLDLITDLDDEIYLWIRTNDDFKNIVKSFNFPEHGLPDPETKLKLVRFDNKFDKLILKIKNSSTIANSVFDADETISKFLQLTRKDLISMPNVGQGYADLLEELQALYLRHYGTEIKTKAVQSDVLSESINRLDLDGMFIKHSSLSTIEKKAILKFENLLGPLTFLKLVNFNRDEYNEVKGLGIHSRALQTLDNLKGKIDIELHRIANGEIDYKNMESELVLSSRPQELSFDYLEAILLEDIDCFLDNLEESQQEIFQCRWGFVEPEKTLEDLGKMQGCTRQRVQQKETIINKEFLLSCRLGPENIWWNLKGHLNNQLPSQMRDLSDCFDNEGCFYNFLSFICSQDSIKDIINPIIKPYLLDSLFEKKGEPVSIPDIKDFLESVADENYDNIENTLRVLTELGKIQVDDGRVYPRDLTMEKAIGCALAPHPKGLPWLDIVKLINNSNTSRSLLPEERQTTALTRSESIYLAGKGIYKHTNHINFSEINIDLIFESLLEFSVEKNRDNFHINEVYLQSKFLQEHDYYLIRHIVKVLGEGFGFYFNGKSSSDSVGLEKDFKQITQLDIILQVMKDTALPMTKPEIAALLKSNSIQHADFLIDGLMNQQKVVRVDRYLYTTYEIAFKNVDLENYTDAIHDIISNETRLIHPSIFQKKLNEKFNQSFSSHLYLAIAKVHCAQNNWYRSGMLFSFHESNYKDLSDAVRTHCDSKADMSTNFKNLRKYIAITSEAGHIAISNWQSALTTYSKFSV